MSDVVLSTTEYVTTVTTVDDVVSVAVTTNPVEVSASTAGVQGASYNQGDPIFVTVRNATGATLPKGTIVYTSGAAGNHTLVEKALATGDATSARTLGWVADAIANNADGFVVVEGYLDGIDTDHIAEGSQLYLSPTVAGSFTATKPSAPEHMVYVGVVTKSNPGNGRVLVKVQNGYELSEIHDVQIISVTDGDILEYDSATDLWKNRDLTTAGIAKLVGGNAFTGAQTITSTASGEFPLSIISALGQTASTFRVRNSANNADLMSIDSSGQIRTSTILNPNSFNNSRLQMQNTGVFIDTGVTTNVPLAVRAASGQTADVFLVQNNTPNSLFRVTTGQVQSFLDMTINGVTGVGTGAASGTAQLFVIPGIASRVGAVIRGAASQSADLFQLQNSAGTNQFRVDQGGMAVANALGVAGSPSGISYSYFTSPVNNAIPVVVRGHATQTSDLQQWQLGDSGVRASVSANGRFAIRSQTLADANASLYASGINVTDKPIVVRGVSGQTANLTEWQDSSANILANVNSAGILNMTRAIILTQTNAGEVGIRVKGAVSQTGNLQEWMDSASSVNAKVEASGQASFLRGNFRGAVYGTGTYFGAVNVLQESGGHGVVVQGRDSQSVDLLRLRLGATSTNDFITLQSSAGTVLGGRNAVGQIYTGSTAPILTATGGTIQSIATGANPLVTMATAPSLTTGDLVTLAGTTGGTYNGTFVVGSTPSMGTFTIISALTVGQASPGGTVSDPAQASVTSRSAGTTGLIVKGASFQSADLLQVQDSASANLLVVSPTGTLRSAGLITAGSSTDVLGQLTSISTVASRVGAVIRGAASQSANLLEIQNSSSTVLTKVDTGGYLGLQGGIFFLNARGAFEQAFGGAFLQMDKVTSAPTNPGASKGRMYFVDGTVPGTLKLVVRAGAAGAETTILDNIPQ